MRLAVRSLTFAALMGLLPCAGARAQDTTPSPEAAAMAESFLEAMGGREVWAEAAYVHSGAINRHPQARLPYIQEYWADLERPRTLNRLRNFDMDRLRGFDVDHGWGIREGEAYTFDARRVEAERLGWQRSIYVKLAAIAKRDDTMAMTWRDGRLSFRRAGLDLGWVELAENGAPTRHAGTAGGAAVSFGELAAFGPINWPRNGSDDSGWGFEILSIELGRGDLPVSFAMPDDPADLDPV